MSLFFFFYLKQPKYIQRLKAIRATLDCSDFFSSHEVIGSSLLFVHDQYHASIWLIDFAKTVILPSDANIDHQSKWSVGNHEDGYLIGINNLIEIFENVQQQQQQQQLQNNNTTTTTTTTISASIVPNNTTTTTTTSTFNKSNTNNVTESSSNSDHQLTRNLEKIENISLNT